LYFGRYNPRSKYDIALVSSRLEKKVDTKKSSEVPATKGMIDETRAELKSDITSLSLEMKSGFTAVDAKIEKVLAAVHSVKALVEDQEARNKYVLDGHTNLHDRQDRMEKELRQDINDIKDSISRLTPPTV